MKLEDNIDNIQVKRKIARVQLKRSAHFVQRNWHRSPHDLQTEFHGFRPLVLPQESRNIVGQSANRQRKRLWMLLLLLLAATQITHL